MEIALIVIYNHKYTGNIDIVENIYKERFSNIFHLVPFYEGSKSNVIPVYENSFCFQGYIAQALGRFFHSKFDHYFFIADDLVVNPIITEKNYCEHLKLKQGDAFIPRLIPLDKNCPWPRVSAAYKFNIAEPGLEVLNEIPSISDARKKLALLNIDILPCTYDQVHDKKVFAKDGLGFRALVDYLYWWLHRAKNKNRLFDLPYPLVGGYSDIFIVPGTSIKRFGHYAGVFAATGLFVEIALPTALVLSSESIVTEDDIEFKGKALWPEGWLNIQDKDMTVRATGLSELEQYGYSLKNLLSNYPPDYLYLHPIKLSKWDTIS